MERSRLGELKRKSFHTSASLFLFLRAIGAMRASKAGDDSALEESILLLRRALDLHAVGFPLKGWYLGGLGIALGVRFERLGRVEDLEEAVEAFRNSIAGSSKRSSDLSSYQFQLGILLWLRYKHFGREEDLHEAIQSLRAALASARTKRGDRPKYLSELGSLLRLRYKHLAQGEDLVEAVEVFRDAVTLTPEAHHDRARYLNNLGSALRESLLELSLQDEYDRPDWGEVLTESIDAHYRSVTSAAQDDPARGFYLSTLASALEFRFRLGPANQQKFPGAGQVKNLDEAIVARRTAVESTPKDNPILPVLLYSLGKVLVDRFEHTGRLDDLEESIDVYRMSVALTPQKDPDRSARLDKLGAVLRERFRRTGRMDDLDEAIEIGSEAVRSTPEEDPHLLDNLGVTFHSRYERTGREEDLNAAIENLQQAVKATPTGHVFRPDYLSHLGNALRARYVREGYLEDLYKAVHACEEAVQETPEGVAGRHRYLSELAKVKKAQYEREFKIEYSKEAVTLFRSALEAIPEGHVDWAAAMSNLGNILQSSGNDNEHEEGITILRQVVALTPNNHPDLPQRLSDLARALTVRSWQKNPEVVENISEAVKLLRLALSSTSTDHPQFLRYLNQLVGTLRARYRKTRRHEDLEEAAELSRTAAGIATTPNQRVFALTSWGMFAGQLGRWVEAAEAYGAAVEQSSLLVPPELSRSDQERKLPIDLGVDAAAACIQAGQPGRAVELFEQGRAVLFSRMLASRSDLNDLQSAYPDLAKRFIQWRDLLDRPEPDPSGSSVLPPGLEDEDDGGGAPSRAAARAALERRRKATAELNRALEEIRECEGYERFMMPHAVEELLTAAEDGPVVLLNLAWSRSDALILTPAGIEVVPLEGINPHMVAWQARAFHDALVPKQNAEIEPEPDPEASAELQFLNRLLKQKPKRRHPFPDLDYEGLPPDAVVRTVLEWLHEHVTEPVLAHLGYVGTPSENAAWPRVWWCPSGVLSLLPLHAAGRHRLSEEPLDAVIDRVVSSTIPTVGALLRARQGTMPSPDKTGRLLMVAMPKTPGQPDLEWVIHEAKTLRTLYPGMVDVLGLPGAEPATYDTVTTALPLHVWVHFSCHGESVPDNPSASRLLLSDYQNRPLTVLDLANLHLEGVHLAFLSACTTSRIAITINDKNVLDGDARFDEPIHITAACQLAGYRNIIGTLWPVGQRTTATVVKHFYSALAATPGSAQGATTALALHHAVRQLRTLHLTHPGRWAPYVHVGP